MPCLPVPALPIALAAPGGCCPLPGSVSLTLTGWSASRVSDGACCFTAGAASMTLTLLSDNGVTRVYSGSGASSSAWSGVGCVAAVVSNFSSTSTLTYTYATNTWRIQNGSFIDNTATPFVTLVGGLPYGVYAQDHQAVALLFPCGTQLSRWVGTWTISV